MKDDVRNAVCRRRDALDKETIQQHSAIICDRVRPYLSGTTALYLAYGSEVDVSALKKRSDICFAIPRTYANHTMRFFLWNEKTRLMKSRYGIWEPYDTEEISDFDVMIIPLVAFDVNCNRLGHGAGFYDRSLKDFKGLKIGVAHECQKVDDVYPQAHDQPLDMIITESHIYKRENR